MGSFKITDIKDGHAFTEPVFIDKQFILLDSGMPFTSKMKSALVEWGFKEVFSDGKESTRDEESLEKVRQIVKTESFESVSIDEVMSGEPNGEQNEKNKVAVEANRKFITTVEECDKKIKEQQESDIEARTKFAEKVYEAGMDYITFVYTRFVTHRELKIGLISEAVDALNTFIKENKKYILGIQPKEDAKFDKNFIVNHSLRSAIFALSIGQTLKMQKTKLIELGVAALLHEIGQIRLPPQLYLTDRKLLPMERALLSTHTTIGYSILQDNDFPISISIGVFEHHERENGMGYPRKLVGDKISLYGKILSVVCSYEAISAPRHYKDAKSTHEAIIELLRNNDKQYDDIVIKALVQSVSLFPIGAYVFLANGKVAQVMDANGDPRTPIVQIIGEKNASGFPLTIQTDNDKLKIVRVLNKSETLDLLKALKK